VSIHDSELHSENKEPSGVACRAPTAGWNSFVGAYLWRPIVRCNLEGRPSATFRNVTSRPKLVGLYAASFVD
jgi:hypothetical protein